MKRAQKSKEKIGNAELSYCARSLVIGIFAATSVLTGSSWRGQGVKNENTQMLKYTNTQIHKYTNTQIHKYSNTQIQKDNYLCSGLAGSLMERSELPKVHRVHICSVGDQQFCHLKKKTYLLAFLRVCWAYFVILIFVVKIVMTSKWP